MDLHRCEPSKSCFIHAPCPQPQPHEEPQEHHTAYPHDEPAPQQASDQQGHPPPRRCPGAPGVGGVVLHGQEGRAGWGMWDGGVGRPDIRIDRYHRVVSSFSRCLITYAAARHDNDIVPLATVYPPGVLAFFRPETPPDSRDAYHATAWQRACVLINSGHVVAQGVVEVHTTLCAIRLS